MSLFGLEAADADLSFLGGTPRHALSGCAIWPISSPGLKISPHYWRMGHVLHGLAPDQGGTSSKPFLMVVAVVMVGDAKRVFRLQVFSEPGIARLMEDVERREAEGEGKNRKLSTLVTAAAEGAVVGRLDDLRLTPSSHPSIPPWNMSRKIRVFGMLP
jgi:hypothetical protein